MADDQEQSNENAGVTNAGDNFDYDEKIETEIERTTIPATTTPPPPPSFENVGDDYADEELPDYVVKLIVNDLPDGVTIPSDLVDAALTDSYGNLLPVSTPLIDSINDYTEAITQAFDDLNNGTAIHGGKKFWGSWGWEKIIIIGLIALCIIGIILAIVFIVIRMKSKKKPPGPVLPTTTTSRNVVTKGISPSPKYQPVSRGN